MKRSILTKLTLALIIIICGMTACHLFQQHPTRPPLSADDVKTLSAEFDRISSSHIEAWNKHDLEPMRQLYTDDIRYHEMAGDETGSDNTITLLMNYTVGSNPNMEVSQTDKFIGRGTGFDVWEMRGWVDIPVNSYNLYTLREGRIAEWWLYLGSEYFTAEATKILEKPLQEYATAWSSGDPEKVANLYDPHAVRTDTLYGENEEGSPSIQEFAAKFFAWYPGVRVEFQKSIQYNMLRVGGVYAIHVSDQAGKPCDVREIILLDLKMNKNTNQFDMIANERVYYQPDTLLACGWAR